MAWCGWSLRLPRFYPWGGILSKRKRLPFTKRRHRAFALSTSPPPGPGIGPAGFREGSERSQCGFCRFVARHFAMLRLLAPDIGEKPTEEDHADPKRDGDRGNDLTHDRGVRARPPAAVLLHHRRIKQGRRSEQHQAYLPRECR